MLNSLLETSSLIQNDSFLIGLCISLGIISIVSFSIVVYACVKKISNEQKKDTPTTEATHDAEPREVSDHIIAPDTVTARSVEKLMSYLQNGEGFDRMVREDIEDAKRNKSISFTSKTMIALNLIHTCISVSLMYKSENRDRYYHINLSNYAMLDFCIYSYFVIRKDLLSSVSRRNIDNMDSDFVSLLPNYCKKRFNIPTHITDLILDKRLNDYEALVDNHRTDEILDTLTHFVLNDFRQAPLSEEIFIVDADVVTNLMLEISTLFKICKDSFIKNVKQIDNDFFAYDNEKNLIKNILLQVWKQSNLFESYLSSYNKVKLLIDGKFQELIKESNKYGWNRHTIPESTIKSFFVETLFDAFAITYYDVFKHEFNASSGMLNSESVFSAFRKSTSIYEPFKELYRMSTLMWKKLNGTIGDLRISWPDGYDPSDFYSSVGDEWIVNTLKRTIINDSERNKLIEIIKGCGK